MWEASDKCAGRSYEKNHQSCTFKQAPPILPAPLFHQPAVRPQYSPPIRWRFRCPPSEQCGAACEANCRSGSLPPGAQTRRNLFLLKVQRPCLFHWMHWNIQSAHSAKQRKFDPGKDCAGGGVFAGCHGERAATGLQKEYVLIACH